MQQYGILRVIMNGPGFLIRNLPGLFMPSDPVAVLLESPPESS
jgi:hypothetical protein